MVDYHCVYVYIHALQSSVYVDVCGGLVPYSAYTRNTNRYMATQCLLFSFKTWLFFLQALSDVDVCFASLQILMRCCLR